MSRPFRALVPLLLAPALALGACGTAPPPPSSTGPVTPAPTPAVTSGAPSSLPSVPTGSAAPTTAEEVIRLQALVAADPEDADAQRALGFALTQRVRETADPSLYAPAEAAFEAALRIDPGDALALVGIAGIQNGKHRFADGLATAERALALSPNLVPAHAAQVDALVELGRYEQADRAAAVMFALSSDLSTLARVSYLAELRGHLKAAVTTMRQATEATGDAPENSAYVEALLGNLLALSGDRAGAKAAYDRALALVPDHAPSLAGEGRLAVEDSRLGDAITLFERASAVVPLPEYVIALGDAQAADGDDEAAAKSYALARAEIQLFESAGVIVDVDLALFEADHGDPLSALEHAKAALAATPTVRAADAVAWALHRLDRDRDALPYVKDALRLGSVDPIIRYHAGAIEAALGDVAAARRDLGMALTLDAGFSAMGAAEARRLLGNVGV